MAIPAPPGYRAVAPFDKTKHRLRGIHAGAQSFAATLHSFYLTVPEFVPAARSYPIVFARDEANLPQPVVLTGLEPGVNLFVQEGRWVPEAYCPAYVRRYPFHTARVTDPEGRAQSLILVEESGLDQHAAPVLLDARGEPTPAWDPLRRLIEDFDAAREQTNEFAKLIDDLGLLEPFEADINPNAAPRKRLTGMLRVAEVKLNELPVANLRELMTRGWLARLYAHLMSLDNFAALLDREAARSRS
ncbi:MAG: SapC family protein [Gammaproteobacteria bacterium]|nr:SapC family protein [Gammaproteobacteria bacterium]MBI5617660.1 SapC family protein [Gammaproteobacteria bacterium]